jgi:hypothetical protein
MLQKPADQQGLFPGYGPILRLTIIFTGGHPGSLLRAGLPRGARR